MAFGVAALVWASGFERLAAVPQERTSVAGFLTADEIESAHTIGRTDAAAVLIMFSDFRCRFCASFVEMDLPKLRRAYVDSGLLQVAFMHNPVPQLRRFSLLAAEVAECGAEQGLFWPVHDQYFANRGTLDERRIWATAAQQGVQLDGDAGARDCVTAGRALTRIGNHVAAAYRFQVVSTPTFLVGARKPSGAVDVSGRFSGANARPAIEAFLEGLRRRGSK